jgi:hypothetical protein
LCQAVLLNTLVAGAHFEAGLSLMHMAYVYHRDDLLAQLTTQPVGGDDKAPAVPRRARRIVPSTVNPERAVQVCWCFFFKLLPISQIRRMIVSVTRQRKHESVRCYAIMDFNTFFLPKGKRHRVVCRTECLEIYDLNANAQVRLFDECIDHTSQKSECAGVSGDIHVCARLQY